MMQYTRRPKGSEFVYKVAGTAPTDGTPIAIEVYYQAEVYYTEWLMDGAVVYRRQFSGRNVTVLRAQLLEVRAGANDMREAGRLELVA